MIKKKNNTYKLIKKNIAKLAIIQQTTEFSPKHLATIFLNNLSPDATFFPKKTKDGYWDWKLADDTAYKYFLRELAKYLKQHGDTAPFQILKEYFKSSYLTKQYFGEDYAGLVLIYSSQELHLKNSVRQTFIDEHPIMPGMTPKEVAIRNQRLGKISVKHWIGDIVNYNHFGQAPEMMMSNLKEALHFIELYIANLLNERDLDQELSNLLVNQRLEQKLITKQVRAKPKPLKI
jgi:hypothetical protein